MKKTLFCIALSVFTSCVWGDVIFTHTGANDPITEGWTLEKTGNGNSAAPILNDENFGFDAWSIVDSSNSVDSLIYRGNISAVQQSVIASNGWKLSVLIRVMDLPTQPNGSSADNNSIMVKVRPGEGSLNFDLVIGYAMSDGKPSIIANGIANRVTNMYSLIDIEYTAKIGEWGYAILTMSIDGVSRYNYTGATANGTGSPYISWGASASETVGHAHWSKLTFSSVSIFRPPRFCGFQVTTNSTLQYQVTDLRRGVYYRFEKSTNLIDWSLLGGYRPSESDDLTQRRPVDLETQFYRVLVK